MVCKVRSIELCYSENHPSQIQVELQIQKKTQKNFFIYVREFSVTESILSQSERSIRAIKNQLKKVDKEITQSRCSEKAPLIAHMEKSVGWTKL